MITLRVNGVEVATRELNVLATACRVLNGPLVMVTSEQVYAYGINFGRSRGGRLARRAGGAHFMEAGATYLRSNARGIIATALERGEGSTEAALRDLGEGAVAAARSRTPRVTGALAGSLRAVVRGG
jgi:hypothetical protein